MKWQAYVVKGTSFNNKKNIPWPRKRNLENKFKPFEFLSEDSEELKSYSECLPEGNESIIC